MDLFQWQFAAFMKNFIWNLGWHSKTIWDTGLKDIFWDPDVVFLQWITHGYIVARNLHLVVDFIACKMVSISAPKLENYTTAANIKMQQKLLITSVLCHQSVFVIVTVLLSCGIYCSYCYLLFLWLLSAAFNELICSRCVTEHLNVLSPSDSKLELEQVQYHASPLRGAEGLSAMT